MGKDKEIPGIHISINATQACTDIPECMTTEEIREVTLEDEHLSALPELILCSWPSTLVERKNYNHTGH